MSSKINTGFKVQAPVAIDTRLILTKAQMISINENIFPNVFLTIDKDTGDLYVYNKNNLPNLETGKFRKLTVDAANIDNLVVIKPGETVRPIFCNVNKAIINLNDGHIYTVEVSDDTSIDTFGKLAEYITRYGEYVEYDNTPCLTVIINDIQFWKVSNLSAYYLSNDTGKIITGLSIDSGTLIESDRAVVELNLTEIPTYKVRDLTEVIQFSTIPEASIDYVGRVVQYTGQSNETYTLGHFYRCTEITVAGSTSYEWQELDTEDDEEYVRHFTVMPAPGDTYLGQLVQYYGEDTANFICGHFYKCISDGLNPPTYSWEGVDTEWDNYDSIEGRPLVLTRPDELYNDTIELSGGISTIVSGLPFKLVVGADYRVTIDDNDYIQLTAKFDGDNIIVTDSELGFSVITPAGYDTSDIKIIDAKFSSNPHVIFTTAPYVTINPDYAEFLSNLGETSENITANVEVGGVSEGQTISKGTSITDVLKQILIKYKKPELEFTTTGRLVNAVGDVISPPIVFTAVSTKIFDKITETSIEGPDGTVLLSGTNPNGETLDAIYTNSITENSVFVAKVTDGKSTVTKELRFKFITPYYYGNSDTNVISDFTGLTKEASEKSNEKVINFTATGKYLTFIYDSSYGDLSLILDQNNFDNTNSWTKSTLTVGSVTFNVYVSNTVITCNNFKYKFIIGE